MTGARNFGSRFRGDYDIRCAKESKSVHGILIGRRECVRIVSDLKENRIIFTVKD